jgi:hypothetical protein
VRDAKRAQIVLEFAHKTVIAWGITGHCEAANKTKQNKNKNRCTNSYKSPNNSKNVKNRYSLCDTFGRTLLKECYFSSKCTPLNFFEIN